MAQTALLFLSDTFLFEADTLVTSSAGDDDGPYVVTAATIFYPGGGGQEPDKGNLITANGTVIPIVKAVLRNGKMYHYLEHHEIQTGDRVTLRIDAEHRLQNARLHTGGHLLSAVVYEKLKLPLLPLKGFHYQQGAYVEFDPLEENPPEADATELQEALAEDIAGQLPVKTANVPETDPAYLRALKPEDFTPPEDRPVRLVTIGNYLPLPCGGTHLHHTGELNFITIKSIKHKKGNIRISYKTG